MVDSMHTHITDAPDRGRGCRDFDCIRRKQDLNGPVQQTLIRFNRSLLAASTHVWQNAGTG